MSVKVDPAHLRYELAIRGLSANALAKRARLSPATVSAALASRPIAEASVMLIVEVLEATPVVDFLRRLVAPIVTESGGDQQPPSPPAEHQRPSGES